ncbi:MAG: response regulator [Deltaproteobacteria bacterium]|nr:response regulator [Deltaproteobacteria bacterium]
MPLPSDRDLYRLFDRSPIGMYRSTEDGRFTYINPALARMLGYTVEELLALDLNRDIYVDPEERPRIIKAFRTHGVIDGVRLHWKCKDGRLLTVQIYGHVVEDEAGGASFDASIVDVTAQEAGQVELQAKHEELERTARTLEIVVRMMPALYWLVDHDLRILRTGGAVEEVLGYPADQFLGATLHHVHAHEPGSADPIAAHRRALAGETISYATEYRHKQLAVTAAPLYRGDRIVGAIGTALDVTATNALERRMVDAQRAESLGVLAGGLAHDFNNLLVAILGNADLGLRDTPSGAPGRAALENVRHAALRAAELTDQLLAYAGRGGIAAVRVMPHALADELLRITASTMPPNVRTTVDIPRELGIRADAAQVRQVLHNLIANARDALGERGGTIAVTARLVEHDGGADPDDIVTAGRGTYVDLAISDDGPGIDRAKRRRIFEPFFTTKPTGHGLGLAAVLGILRSHEGGLRLVSAPGATTFHVLWPAATSADASGEHVVPAPPARTVLIIDDEDLVRDVVARMIEDLGYAAVTAADGQTGLAMIDDKPIDAVLVDLTMPHMSGADTIKQLRRKKPSLPVILCSGFDRDRRGPVHADAYLPKPFRIEALEQTLARLLR